MPHFMILLILYINSLNLSLLKKKCLLLRNMEPLKITWFFSNNGHFEQLHSFKARKPALCSYDEKENTYSKRIISQEKK